jgi:hypothetical protein
MKKLLRSGVSSIVCTVTELTTISTPEYLFEFINEQSDDDNDTQYAVLTDTSSYTGRFNEFSIEDGVDVTFPNDGYYTYNIYEQVVSGSVDPTGKTVVERGRVHVYSVDAAESEYTDTTQADKIYEDE